MLFIEIMQKITRRSAPAGQSLAAESLAHLEYPQELAGKNQALQEFWKAHHLPQTPGAIVAAPKPRQYRTTTKRQVLVDKGQLHLLFTQEYNTDQTDQTDQARQSRLEPTEHVALYALLAAKLNEPSYRLLTGVLNFVIIRGNYTERTVLFNVSQLDGTIVRKLKHLGDWLPTVDPAAVAAFIFHDPTRSRFYLDTGYSAGLIKTKRLYGPGTIRVNFGGSRYVFPPTVFSQVNEAMVPLLLATVKELLQPAPEEQLIDLYCGYGLFTLYLAGSYARACGLEAAPESIAAAEKNSRYFPAASQVRFRVSRIAGDAFLPLLPKPDGRREVVLADPPRQGMPPDVIAAVCRRKPAKILEACCGIDEIPRQIAAWQAGGYRVKTIRPLDLFPGTPHLETLILFEPI